MRLKDPAARKERQKERNRTHAKVSRLRKKFFISTLEDKNRQLAELNLRMQRMVEKYAPASEREAIMAMCHNRVDNISMGALRADGGTRGSAVQGCVRADNKELMQNLAEQSRQTSFLLTDPKLPDNPIVFASDGFIELTGTGVNILHNLFWPDIDVCVSGRRVRA